jgi:protein SCO1
MSDDKRTTEQTSGNSGNRRRPRPLLLTGSILWACCLVAIIFGWYEWRQKHLAALAELKSGMATSDDEPQKSKEIKLIPRRDGSFVAKEVTPDDKEGPWDVEGIEDFSFTDCNGQTVSKQDLLGKPFVIAFVFTLCRGPCPNVTAQMREIQDRLKDYDFNLVTLTVDPARDTAETLRQYGKDQGANFDRWKFLTGDQTEIYGSIQNSFKMPVQELTGAERQPGFEILHSTNIMLVDATGRVVGKYNAQKDEEMAKLRREIRRIANNKNGTKKDAADPTGRVDADNILDEDQSAVPALPSWAAALPAVNAGLNGLAGVMLATGYVLIKRKQRSAHAWSMIAAFVTSILFLGCYLAYHYALHAYTGEAGKRFGHQGTLVGVVYLLILITHVILAAVVPVLASITLYRAWRQDWFRHRRVAVITFPIWVYVSVTGVIIYTMLYHWPGAAP